jgi:maltooligosyltrehalose trehalohydrolase
MTGPESIDGAPTRPPVLRMGATVVGTSTSFVVWAPTAETVDVEVRTCDGRHIESSMIRSCDGDRNDSWNARWTVTHAEVAGDDRYRFRIDGGAWLADPASRRQPDGVHGASCVVDPAQIRWTDHEWRGVELVDTVLYELHVGTFTPAGTFDGAIGELARLADLGVSTIELMPIAAFPGTRNWGYDGVFPSAVHESYGGPAGLARFVDSAHAHGLAVVIDVVYNHFGPEGSIAASFGPYFTDAFSTPWGSAINVAGPGADAVRRFFIESAVGWIDDYHVDGLRLDAMHAMIDPTAITFLEELTSAVHDAGARLNRTVLVTVEHAGNDPRVVRPRTDRGWGADAVWNDDFHHALRVALTGEQHGYYAGFDGVGDVADALAHRWVYRGQHSAVFGRRHGATTDDVTPDRFIAFSQNHDHVGNTPLGHRLLADTPPGDPRRRLAPAAVLLSPFTPMLFMGEEYGETAPFPYFVDHGDPDLLAAVREGRRREFSGADWSRPSADPTDPATFRAAILRPDTANDQHHRATSDLYAELIRLRRRHRVLHDPGAEQTVELLDHTVVVRRSNSQEQCELALHFGAAPRRWAGSDAHADADDDADDPATLVFDSDASPWGPGSTPSQLGSYSCQLRVRHR